MLLDWRIDVALVEGPVADNRFVATRWLDDELIVIAYPTHPFVGQGEVPVSNLADEPFIVREPGSGTREVARRALAERGVQLRRTMRVGGTEVIKQAVAAGLGLAIVSRAAVADQLALGRIVIVPISGLTMRREFSRLELRGRKPTSTARAFNVLLDEASLAESVPDASGHA
jgi:DNA-binding transcriptional LysR family regulator